LMLLPGGDRAKGLREMLQAREHGRLLAGEADYQLHLLYLWYEHRTAHALSLLRSLDERYSSNPLFLERIAEVHDTYVHDVPASAAAWQQLIHRIDRGQISSERIARVRAGLGLARALDAMFETDRAVTELKTVVESNPPARWNAQAQLQLALAYDRLGARDLAVETYSAAIKLASGDDAAQIWERARAGLKQVPDAKTSVSY